MSIEERDYMQLESQDAVQEAPAVATYYREVLQWIIMALCTFLLSAVFVRMLGIDQLAASVWWVALLILCSLAPLTLNFVLEASPTLAALSFFVFWASMGLLATVALAPTGHLYGGLPFEIALVTAIGVLVLFWIGNSFLKRDPTHPKTTLFATLIPMTVTMMALSLFSSTGWISQITLLFLFIGFFGAHTLFTRIGLRMKKQKTQKTKGPEKEGEGESETELPLHFAARVLFDPLIHPFTIVKRFLQK